jgi:predicted NAD/FAD-binding protein
MRRFPLPLFLRFFENHGLLDIRDRPQWYVIANIQQTVVFKEAQKQR